MAANHAGLRVDEANRQACRAQPRWARGKKRQTMLLTLGRLGERCPLRASSVASWPDFRERGRRPNETISPHPRNHPETIGAEASNVV
jgi:hypothetical protein